MIIDNVLFVEKSDYEKMKQYIIERDEIEYLKWYGNKSPMQNIKRNILLNSFDIHRRALKMLRINGNRQVVIYNKK